MTATVALSHFLRERSLLPFPRTWSSAEKSKIENRAREKKKINVSATSSDKLHQAVFINEPKKKKMWQNLKIILVFCVRASLRKY